MGHKAKGLRDAGQPQDEYIQGFGELHRENWEFMDGGCEREGGGGGGDGG